ncbi:MAG: hypothetical protein U9N49_11075, partial [Campylobacterota bacterium]|nr:hypothetical protein [Campylobacterota bacterium]
VNAIVTGYSNQFNRLAATRSDENGSYKLYIQEYRGLIIVEATCDKDSTMKAFDGSIKACPLDTRLRTLGLAKGRSTPAIAHITPLTEMIFVRAQALSSAGTISDIAFEQARAEISEIFGVNPLIDNPTQGAYFSILTAINEVAANNPDKTVQEIVDEIADDISDGTTGDTNSTQDLADEIEDNGVNNNLTDNNGSYTPTTGENIDGDGDGNISVEESIESAKDMFKNLRSSTLALVDYETANQSGTVDTELRDFGRLIAAFEIKMDTASVYKTDILSAIFKAIKDGKLESSTTIGEGVGMALTITKTTATQWNYKFGSSDIYQGTVSAPTVDPSVYTDSNNYNQLKFAFDGTLPAYRSKDGMSELGVQSLKGDLYISNEGDLIKITLLNALVKSANDQINVSKMVVRSDKLIKGSYTQLEEIVFNGTIAQYLVDARIDVTQYTQNSAISNNSGYLPNEVKFDGMMHNQNSGTKIDATIKAKWQDVTLMNQDMVDKYAYKELIDLDLVVASGDHLLFTHGYDQEPLIDITINGTIDIAQHASQIVDMQLQNYSDGRRTLNITYTGEGMFAQAQSTFSSVNGDNGVITVSNNLGITGTFIVLNGTLLAGDDNGNGSIVTKDNTQIGKVDSNLIIRYNDGYLESIL